MTHIIPQPFKHHISSLSPYPFGLLSVVLEICWLIKFRLTEPSSSIEEMCRTLSNGGQLPISSMLGSLPPSPSADGPCNFSLETTTQPIDSIAQWFVYRGSKQGAIREMRSIQTVVKESASTACMPVTADQNRYQTDLLFPLALSYPPMFKDDRTQTQLMSALSTNPSIGSSLESYIKPLSASSSLRSRTEEDIECVENLTNIMERYDEYMTNRSD